MAKHEPRKCVVCGKEFVPTKSNQLCCSKNCSLKRWRSNNPEYCAPPREIKNCIICGKEFMPIRSGHVCCSKKCTNKRNKETQRQNDAMYREMYKAQKAMPQSLHKERADITIAARKEGLSYGQYVAKYGL